MYLILKKKERRLAKYFYLVDLSEVEALKNIKELSKRLVLDLKNRGSWEIDRKQESLGTKEIIEYDFDKIKQLLKKVNFLSAENATKNR